MGTIRRRTLDRDWLPISRASRWPLGTLALVLVAFSWIVLMHAAGPNQNAHLALVKSLAVGTPRVDRYRNETSDVSYTHGHYFAAKAPGLALATEPYYLGLKFAHLAVTDHVSDRPFPEGMLAMPRSAVWQVALVGALLPALVALFLVRMVADRLVPGYGTAAAVVLGAGSLLGFFATLFFDHALSTCLGFAAFAVLIRERRFARDTRSVAVAGAIAGCAVTVELPLAIVAVTLAVYAAGRGALLPRLSAYAAGFGAGLIPLLAFDTWAFGSPTRLPYVNAVSQAGVSGHDVLRGNAPGFFGVQVPSLRVTLELLVSSKGLLVLTPVWALAAVGVCILWRRGFRGEAAVIGFVPCAFVVYNSAYIDPFGGFSGGPRFLVPLLPFVAVAVAASWSAFPLLTGSLAFASVAVTSVAQTVDPTYGAEDAGTWFHRLERGELTRTLLGWLGLSDKVGILIVLFCVVGAMALALAVTGRFHVDVRNATLAIEGLLLWRILYVAAPIVLESTAKRALAGSAVVLAMAGAVSLLLLLTARRGPRALVPAVALLPLVWPAFAAHIALAAAAVSCSLLAAAVLVLLDPRRVPGGGARMAR